MRRAAPIALAWLASAAAPAPAQTLSGDGDRWVAWDGPGAERTTVRDDAAGITRRVERPPGCGLAAVGGGNLLWACRDSLVVLDLASGARRELPVDDPPDGSVVYTAVGRLWIERSFSSYHNDGLLSYVHVESGEVRGGPSGRPRPGDAAPGRRETIDLDEPDLATPLCRPLARSRRDEFEATPAYYPYLFDGRVGVDVVWGTIRVQRCGQRKARALRADCQGFCDVSAGAGRVVFVRRFAGATGSGVLGVHHGRTGRTRCLRTRLTDGFVHTRRGLWLTGGGRGPRPVAFPRERC